MASVPQASLTPAPNQTEAGGAPLEAEDAATGPEAAAVQAAYAPNSHAAPPLKVGGTPVVAPAATSSWLTLAFPLAAVMLAAAAFYKVFFKRRRSRSRERRSSRRSRKAREASVVAVQGQESQRLSEAAAVAAYQDLRAVAAALKEQGEDVPPFTHQKSVADQDLELGPAYEQDEGVAEDLEQGATIQAPEVQASVVDDLEHSATAQALEAQESIVDALEHGASAQAPETQEVVAGDLEQGVTVQAPEAQESIADDLEQCATAQAPETQESIADALEHGATAQAPETQEVVAGDLEQGVTVQAPEAQKLVAGDLEQGEATQDPETQEVVAGDLEHSATVQAPEAQKAVAGDLEQGEATQAPDAREVVAGDSVKGEDAQASKKSEGAAEGERQGEASQASEKHGSVAEDMEQPQETSSTSSRPAPARPRGGGRDAASRWPGVTRTLPGANARGGRADVQATPAGLREVATVSPDMVQQRVTDLQEHVEDSLAELPDGAISPRPLSPRVKDCVDQFEQSRGRAPAAPCEAAGAPPSEPRDAGPLSPRAMETQLREETAALKEAQRRLVEVESQLREEQERLRKADGEGGGGESDSKLSPQVSASEEDSLMNGTPSTSAGDSSLPSDTPQKPPEVQANKLEERFAGLEEELSALEQRASASSESTSPKAPMSSEEDMDTADWRPQCELLAKKMEALTADALERSVKREESPGALDVFQEANEALDRMADLLSVPRGCDAQEWRIIVAATDASEQEALRLLLLQLQGPEGAVDSSELRLHTLLRFLRARRGSVPQAAAMFKKALAWRESYAIDRRLESWTAELAAAETVRARIVEQYRIHETIGKDRYGMPVILFRWSVFDVAGLERELGIETMLQVILCIHEQLITQMDATMLASQQYIPGGLYVWDIGNYGAKFGAPNWVGRMWSLVRFLPKIASLLEMAYPEAVRKIMVVRSGPAAKALHAAAAAVMPSSTWSKCKLFGWHANEWVKELQDEVVEGSLPAFLMRDDDEALASAQPSGGICPRGAGFLAASSILST